MTSRKKILAISIVLLLSILFFRSCNNRNIEKLANEKINFNDLPFEIKEYLKNPTDLETETNLMLLELPKGKDPSYRLETVGTWIGPWVDHEKLINIREDISFEIDQGVPSPYIIFEDKLYIPDRFNIFTTVDDLSSLVFTRYDLK